MGRRKRGLPINGWVVLDKPGSMTSTQALAAVKRLFDAQKAGHAGTLDPMATGILPLAFGEATKTVPFAVDGAKSYRFTVRWGAQSATDDAEGEITETSELRPERGAIEQALAAFRGEIMQVPPCYSAIKVDGHRAYDLAREGEVVKLAARPVFIERLELIEATSDTAVFEADCGKGTYVRSIARDLGRMLGCLGYVIALRRTRVGPFTQAIAVTLDDLRHAAEQPDDGGGALSAHLMPVETALDDVPELAVSQTDAANLAMGRSVLIRGRDAPVLTGPMFATCKGRIVALGEVAKGALHPTRVFNLG